MYGRVVTSHIVVTGGTGALGAAVVERLLARGATVHLPMLEAEPPAHLRHARIVIDVGNDRGLAVQHGPARNAGLKEKALALPQGGDGVLVDIAAAVAVADHEGDPVGA